jgi:hypothetical protein
VIAGYATLERQAAAMQRDIRALRQSAEIARKPKQTALDIAATVGIALDPWQRQTLTTDRHDILMLVTRQGGKGEVATLLALDKVLNDPGSTTVVVSRAGRQARRLLRRIKRRYRQLDGVPPTITDSAFAFELRNGSEILALPGSEETIRGVEAVDLLIVDEAALVPDELFGAVYPMLATTDGRCVAMSTPRGKRGWFWHEYAHGGDAWHRAKVTCWEIPRIKRAWLERTRDRIGVWMFSQEFECEFLDAEDQLFATEHIAAALVDGPGGFGLPMFAGHIQGMSGGGA